MAKINVKISDELNAQFREKVFKKYNMRKGSITTAIEEAIKLWINEKEDDRL